MQPLLSSSAHSMGPPPFDISIAPMMDWTDRHFRFFLRLLSPHARLYTEMVTTGAILYGDYHRHLAFHPQEHPVVLQLGGSDPAALAQSAHIGADYGYDEINLNCGCPSDRVQNGAFGACLMKDPARVADCVAAMVAITDLPVTVKCRIGVDDCDDLAFLMNFVETVKEAGCGTFVIHARKAWLNGLSPKENREKPPLRYEVAAAIKDAYPDLRIILNGGITSLQQIIAAKTPFDGVMIGREAYQNPYFMAEIDHALHSTPLPDRRIIALQMIPYMEQQHRDYGTPVKSVTRHILGLFAGQRGGKAWRRILSTEAFRDDVEAGTLIRKALKTVDSNLNLPVAA